MRDANSKILLAGKILRPLHRPSWAANTTGVSIGSGLNAPVTTATFQQIWTEAQRSQAAQMTLRDNHNLPQRFTKELRSPVVDIWVDGEIEYPTAEVAHEISKAIQKACEAFEESGDLQAVKQFIETEFRQIL